MPSRVWRGSDREPERGERPSESMYSKDALASEGSELCFEEARARTYLRKRRLKREAEERLKRKRAGEGSLAAADR